MLHNTGLLAARYATMPCTAGGTDPARLSARTLHGPTDPRTTVLCGCALWRRAAPLLESRARYLSTYDKLGLLRDRTFARYYPERQQSARRRAARGGNMLPQLAVAAPLGAALACDSGENDVQQSIVAQMDLDTMLVFAQACRGGQKAAAMRLQQVATLAQLSGVPSAGWFRRADKHITVSGGSRYRGFITHGSNWNHSDIHVINFLIMWGIKEMERGRRAEAEMDPVARGLPRFKRPLHPLALCYGTEAFHLSVLKNPWSFAATSMALHALQALGAVICKQLKAAHASGVGCGRPQIWTSRQEIVRHVQDSPLNLCAGSVPCSPLLVRHRDLILCVLEDFVAREYAEYKIDDPELLRYLT